jgi:16S rRNA C1402 N4-methylase RsmH
LDPKVIEYYKQNYEQTITDSERKRLHITNANFTSITSTKIFDKFDVILTDFGFNSYHLETDRGFSWLKDEDLDMRYSPSAKPCSEIVFFS